MARQFRWILALVSVLILVNACDDESSSEEVGASDMMTNAPDGTLADGFSGNDMSLSDTAGDATMSDMTANLPCDAPVPMSVDTMTQRGVAVTNGMSETFTVDLPDDVVSLTILTTEPTDTIFLGIGLLEGPGGERLIEENPPGFMPGGIESLTSVFPGPFASPNRYATAASGVGGMLAPNNPSVNVTPGTWRYQILAANETRQPASTTVDVTLLIKRAAGTPNCGVLDIHLYFTGANGWTAENAPNDAMVQDAIERMRGFYSNIGIALGEITYDNATAPMMVSALGGAGSDLHQMFAQNTYTTGLAFFFVEELTSPLGGGLTIGGIAGGTPGPTLQPGTGRSGVAVATSSIMNAEQLGHVMGHEGGHFLGLFHTQEIFGATDQIDDTPTGMDDMSNLMFPTVTDQDAMLSPGQGFVLLRNASVVTP